MNELLPCPFCGGEAEALQNGSWWCVACRTPFCCDVGKFETEAEAIAAWNTRAEYHGYEQAAIEAWESIKKWNTRSERTCEITYKRGAMYDVARYSCCGYELATPVSESLPAENYCPNCGAKVVD